MADPTLTLDALPLFPLQLVLYPGGVLPLRIFEVRYLDMIGRAYRDGTPFGVVSLIEGQDVQQPSAEPTGEAFALERFHRIGTLATLTRLERPQPGLMVVRCAGTQRFSLTGQQRLSHGLWLGQAQLLAPDVALAVPDDLVAARDALRAIVSQFVSQVQSQSQGRQEPGDELPIDEPFLWDDCGWVAHRWCELLPLPAALKQRLLETDSPLLRLELVADLLEQLRLAPR